MIYFNANGRSAECSVDEPITTGSVGIPVKFTFSSEWDGLAKTAVFKTDETIIDVFIPDDACVVPPDAITKVGRKLVIGVYGTNGTDVVIPTVYASAGFIMKGAEPSGIEPTPHTQSLVDQILAAAQTAQDAAEDAVEAAEDAQETAQSVRDDADAGAFDGEDGNCIWWTTDAIAISGSVYYTQERNVQGRAGATPQAKDLLVGPSPGTAGDVTYLYSVRGIYNTYVYLDGIGSIKGATGQQGPAGPAGPQGQRGEQGPAGPSGEDGFSPTVTVTEIEGGHRVTITDEDGDHVFDVMDGEASIAKTVSGEILAIEDGVADKPTALSVEIPYQSGGISGFTMRFRRRNMLDLTGTITSAGLTYTPQSDGTLEINGTATGNSRYGAFGSTSYISASNTYSLPAGTYTVFAQWEDTETFSAGWHVYVGTSTTKIGDFSSSGAAVLNNATSRSGRVSCQFASGTSFDHKRSKLFMGVGTLNVEDFDAPSTTRYELEVDIGQTVYGGTADLTGGFFLSKYAADGTELAEPVEIPITAEIPTLYEGANTIWASVIGSVVTMTYGKTVKDYVDEKTDALQTEIDTLDATTQGQLTGEFSSLGMFAKIGVIGDSFAQGSIHYPGGSGVYKPLSWGKHLERDLGVAVTLYTHGGYATFDWITDTTYGLPKLEADAVTSPCDLYWFGLGINDSAYYDDHPDYLGALTDISEHVSGEAWAATFYGNVGQIVERIQAAAPSSKIVIASFVADRPKAPRTWDTALNDALADVAEYFGLPFIDLRDDPFYMSDFYTAEIYGDHPTAIGYAGMAKANERLFARAAVESRSYFMGYHNSTAFPSGGGGTSDYDDLTNKPQIGGVTLSGNKSLADLGIAAVSDIPTVPSAYANTPADLGTASAGSSTSWARGDHVHKMPSASDVGAYALPSGGIPKTDLASAVQTSLGKADTALQTAPVSSVNGQTGAVVLSASDVGAGTYSKPSGGIPKTDLASAVQTSLGKADTALQSYTETDPTVPSWAKASSKPAYTASEVGAIAAPASPATGAFLVWNGSAWTAQTLATWQGGNY